MKILWTIAVLFMGGSCFVAQQPGTQQHRLADSLRRKLDYIHENAASAHPNPAPTVMTEEEINDYFAAGDLQIPKGVKKVAFQGQSGVITGFASVDFDEIRAGQRSSNPLLSMFSGLHNIRVEAEASGAGGKASVHVRSVSLDGNEIPRTVLIFFVEKYVTPKYPTVGMDSEFQMPDKVDTAIVGYHKLTVMQK